VKQGDTRAMFDLGVIYENGGNGEAPDYAQARSWYQKSLDGGFKEAADGLKRLDALAPATPTASVSTPGSTPVATTGVSQ
jgi:TPR repeat protein